MIKIAIDRGGTFTDIYAIYNNKIYIKKILSESKHYEDANSHGIRLILQDIFGKNFDKINLDNFSWVRLGTTVATNALLEKQGSSVTLLITKGFSNLLEIGYQNRSELFAINPKKNPPLYTNVIEVNERLYPKDNRAKILKELNLKELEEILKKHKDSSIAVVLLHSNLDNTHELAIKELAKKLNIKNISISSEVSASLKAVDRGNTTIVDAYLTPILKEYQSKILKNFTGDTDKIFFMKSDGNLCEHKHFRGSVSLLSGPAGGVVALKSIYNGTPLIGFDMGGTSSDVSRYNGEIELKYYDEINNIKVATPTVDIHTVASGGGSRLFYRNGMFIVGPESSKSDPGPLCYGKGGFLSITDANLVTNRLDVEFFPKIFGKTQDKPLDKEASINGFKEIANKLNKRVEEVAEGFLDVANETMANAIKEITTKKGFNVKEHILCAFGGAGGQHAVGVARKLGIKKIFIHKNAGILSAIGIANAEISKTFIKNFEQNLNDLDLNNQFSKIVNQYKENYDTVKRKVLLKYSQTTTTIEVDYKDNFLEEFYRKHKSLFGFLLNKDIVVESIKVDFITQSSKLTREKLPKKDVKPVKTVQIYLNGKYQKADVYKDLTPNLEIKGPALIIQDISTVILDEKSTANINEYGDITITLDELKSKKAIKEVELALLSNRFKFIATKMGDTLQKTALSTNIKERLDFSCAIFDRDGNLISNAPHIPVHLGSMSSVVKAIIKKFKKIKESTYITNAPYEGGSHLPDITVVTPYIKDGEVLFWCASRGHHSDIGGITPGSMPPNSTSLSQEGAVIEAFEIVKDGIFQEEKIVKILKEANAKNINNNISDIKAQISANIVGISGVKELLDSNIDIFTYMQNIQEISSQQIVNFLKKQPQKVLEALDFLDNGAKIKLKVYIDNNGCATFDFRGSSYELLSNQNAPISVLKSAIIYSLRVMLNSDIPLNEGIIKPIKILIDKNSILNPSKDAAVVGGNVTTSQRVVDVIFKAFGIVAASQGCMNNVIFGNKEFGYYETIGGGVGASSFSNGASALQSHMTNTRITDIEVIEREYPVKINSFKIRKNSGGDGAFRGGDGIVREYQFLKECEVSILTERRVYPPYGLNGGSNGKVGKNLLKRGDRIYNLTSKATFKAKKDDILIIKTPGGGGWGKK